MNKEIEKLQEIIDDSENIVFFGGAGVSTESNIPDFRSADGLYQQLQDAGVEVIYDDRKVSAGNMFSDADLLGVPVRVIVSPKTIKRGAVEISKRDKSLREDVEPANAVAYVTKLVRDMLDACR